MRMRKFYWPAVSALTALLLTISASIAFADQVVNDVVAGGKTPSRLADPPPSTTRSTPAGGEIPRVAATHRMGLLLR